MGSGVQASNIPGMAAIQRDAGIMPPPGYTRQALNAQRLRSTSRTRAALGKNGSLRIIFFLFQP